MLFNESGCLIHNPSESIHGLSIQYCNHVLMVQTFSSVFSVSSFLTHIGGLKVKIEKLWTPKDCKEILDLH